MRKVTKLTLTFIFALLAIAGLLGLADNAGMIVQSQDPIPASVIGVDQISWYTGGVAITETTYYYGPSENSTLGQNILFWNQAELFATVVLSTSSQTATITPQFSADGTNWTDADYTNPDAWSSSVSIITTGTVTSTIGTITTSIATAGATSSTTTDRALAFSAAGTNTDMLSFPLFGKYMRLKAEVITSAYWVTPTFRMILKNK